MSTSWRHEHKLDAGEAARRLTAFANEKGVTLNLEPDGLGGEVARETPFGAARARWRSRPGCVEVEILEKPAFVPIGMIERALRDGLARVLETAAPEGS